jgi:hypothetical protein
MMDHNPQELMDQVTNPHQLMDQVQEKEEDSKVQITQVVTKFNQMLVVLAQLIST